MATLKQVENSGSVVFQKTVTKLGEKTLSGSDLKFTLCDVSDLTNRPYGNLFSSFNFPITDAQKSDFLNNHLNIAGNDISKLTAFKNLITDANGNFINKIIIAEIPQNQYGELIDGKTIHLKVPITSASTQTEINCFGTYFGPWNNNLDQQLSDTNQASALFGIDPSKNTDKNSNVAYLFSNEIARPKVQPTTTIIGSQQYQYPGTVTIPANTTITRTITATTTPNSSYFLRILNGSPVRRVTVTNENNVILLDQVINSEQLFFTNTFVPTVTSSQIIVKVITASSLIAGGYTSLAELNENSFEQNASWSKWTQTNKFPTSAALKNGKFYASFNDTVNNGIVIDEPVGIAYLDKGFCVLTHPTIVENFLYSGAKSSGFDNVASGTTYSGDENFTQIYFDSSADAFVKYDSVVTEFVQSIMAIAMPGEFYISTNPTFEEVYGKDGVNNAQNDPVYITEIGLYNQYGELIAIAKCSEGIPKTRANIAAFNIQLKL